MSEEVDYDKIAVPGNCPVCNLNIFQTTIKREIKDWQDPDHEWRWWCHYCNSFFTWDAESRIVRNVETRFMRGLLGNVDIAAINKGMGHNRIDPKLPDEFDPKGYNHRRNFK